MAAAVDVSRSAPGEGHGHVLWVSMFPLRRSVCRDDLDSGDLWTTLQLERAPARFMLHVRW